MTDCPDCTPYFTCARCTQARVNYIQMLEKETGIDIKNSQYLSIAEKFYKDKQKAQKLEGRLREVRKKKGWSLEAMAAHLGVSIGHLSNMELGRKPLTESALSLIKQHGFLG